MTQECELNCGSVVPAKLHHDATKNGVRSEGGNPNENCPARSTPRALSCTHRLHRHFASQSFEPGTNREQNSFRHAVEVNRPISRRASYGRRRGGVTPKPTIPVRP